MGKFICGMYIMSLHMHIISNYLISKGEGMNETDLYISIVRIVANNRKTPNH